MKYPDLTDKQAEVYEYLLKEFNKNGYAPSVREIMIGLQKTSTSTIQAHMDALRDKGYITRSKGRSRAIEFLREDGFDASYSAGEVVHLPVLGRVAAGSPMLAEQNIEETIPFPAAFVKDDTFLLKVSGESMIEAGIFDGDYVAVQRQQTATNGDYIVALIDDEATVKTYYREANRVRLQPENSSMDPIYVYDNAVIVGKVIALFRSRM